MSTLSEDFMEENMGNHIVIEPACKIREIARNALAGYWKPVVIGVLIYFLLTSGIETILDNLFAFTNPVEVYGQDLVETIPYGGSIYNFIIGGPLELGFTIFLLTFFRSRKVDNTLLFEGFSSFTKAFLLFVLMTVKIILWSLLLVVPGIIASFRYSQAFYVLADNPDMSANQCLKESSRIMAGNKGRYFYLQLTFIGWYILAALPGSIYTTLSDGTGAVSVIMSILFGLPSVVLSAYVMTANTAFYELATEKLVVMNGTDYDNMVNAEYTVKEESAPAADDEAEDEVLAQDEKPEVPAPADEDKPDDTPEE